MSNLSVSVLISVAALASALQKSGHMASFSNHRERAADQPRPVSGNTVCRCCWRECDPPPNNMQYLEKENMQYSAAEKRVAAPDIVVAWLMLHFFPGAVDLVKLNMYTSLLNTVKEGLEAEGVVARIIGSPDMKVMISAIKGAVAQGRRPLFFIVAHDWMAPINATFCKLREAKEAGAYLVQYNSEPSGNEFNSAGNLAHLDLMLDWAAEMGADEVWDYSIAQIQHYPQRENRPVIRYVPPGYTRFMDVGVNWSSHLTQTEVMGYLGVIQDKSCSMQYEKVLGNSLHHETDVWTLDGLRVYMETYPLQLNQHRSQTCFPREQWEDEFQHFESFRMSHVLSNKACVISPPSAISEMDVWKDIVTFVEVENTLSALQSFARDPQKLLDCRTHAYNVYKNKFNGRVLLHNAGFWQAWRKSHGV